MDPSAEPASRDGSSSETSWRVPSSRRGEGSDGSVGRADLTRWIESTPRVPDAIPRPPRPHQSNKHTKPNHQEPRQTHRRAPDPRKQAAEGEVRDANSASRAVGAAVGMVKIEEDQRRTK
jgi:hypothetical protein